MHRGSYGKSAATDNCYRYIPRMDELLSNLSLGPSLIPSFYKRDYSGATNKNNLRIGRPLEVSQEPDPHFALNQSY